MTKEEVLAKLSEDPNFTLPEDASDEDKAAFAEAQQELAAKEAEAAKVEEEKAVANISSKIASTVKELVNAEVANQSKKKEAEEKKAAVFGDVKVNSYTRKLFSTKSGKDVLVSGDEVDHLSKWFKSFVAFKKQHSPDEYAAMKKEYAILEQMAVHQKLEPLQTGVAAEGGNLVPTILYNKIIPLLEEQAVIRQNANVIDMKGIKTLALPGVASVPHVSWNSEAAQKATTSAEFNQISLTPYILAGIIVITQQLIDDAPFAMIQLIGQMLATAIAKEEDRAFVAGSGTGQPTGITTYTPSYTIAAGGALAYSHLNAAYWGLGQAYRSSSKLRWLMHSRTISLVSGMVDTTGRPIFDATANSGSFQGQPRLFGVPVLENNDFGENSIWLVDLAWYWIGYSRTLSIDTADQATIRSTNLWERNEIAIRAEEKVDGELVTTRAAASITAVRT